MPTQNASAIGCGPLTRCARAPTANSTTPTRQAACLRLPSWSASRISSSPTITDTTWPTIGTHSGPIASSRAPNRECTNGIMLSSWSTPQSAVSPAIVLTARGCSSAGLGRRDGVRRRGHARQGDDGRRGRAVDARTGDAARCDGRRRGERARRPARSATRGRGELGAQRREEDHLADRVDAGQQHHQPVDPDPEAARRRHPVLQRADVVVVDVTGLRVAALLGARLGLERGELLGRVVLLAVGVAQLEPGDDQLEALDVGRVVAVHPGQRRHLARVVDAEHRADDVVLHLLVVDLLHEPARAPAALVGDVQAVEDGPGLRDRHVRVHRRAGLLGDHVGEPGARPGRREVDGLPGVVDRGRVAERGLRRRGHEALGQVHHVVVVGEGLVGLQHRELGVVPGVDALVAEHPPDLEHPLQPADDEPLEVQLQRDPQVEVDVQGVVVGDERAGRRAALDRLQHRALDLGETQAVQVVADRVDRGVPDPEDLAGALVGLEVDVALPVAGLDVGEPAVLVGRRQQRLGQQRELPDADGELTAPGGHHGPGDADPVAAVQLVEVAVHRGADDGGVDEELDGPGAVAQRGEGQPALAADELQPAGDVDLVLGDLVGSQPGVSGPDAGRGGVGGVAVRVAGAACLVGLAEPLLALAVGGG